MRTAKDSLIGKIWLQNRPFQFILLVIWVIMAAYLASPLIRNHRFATLKKVLDAGRITVITRNNAHCYYFYRDQPMGFEYDLAHEFSKYLGVELQVLVVDQWDEMIPALKRGEGAFIAASLTMTPRRKEMVAFSDSYMDIRQHIVTHRERRDIRNVQDLNGLTVHVRKGTSYQDRLQELRASGIDVQLNLIEDIPTEELIRQVAEGKIEATIADSNVALLNRRHYPSVVIAGQISDRQMLAWAVEPDARELLAEINRFFKKVKRNGRLDEIFKKYYGDIDEFDYVDLRAFHRRIKTRLSRFSPFIKQSAREHGFDWRLIAAQIYQESHWNPWAKSPAGAGGLMQLIPATAKRHGVDNLYDPLQNIKAGVQHLKNLYDRFEEAAEEDRMRIALAAYNTGVGHVYDARKLAEKMGLDPNRWESLAHTLPLLRLRKYYRNAQYGYCRGDEPVMYVKQIYIYYDILKRRDIEFRAAIGPPISGTRRE
jgi:membrane-bound lytic murein transglycosylase F